jgi:hypothetical protein
MFFLYRERLRFTAVIRKGNVGPVLIHYVIKKYSRVQANTNAFLVVKLVGYEW